MFSTIGSRDTPREKKRKGQTGDYETMERGGKRRLGKKQKKGTERNPQTHKRDPQQKLQSRKRCHSRYET